ncbi:MAG: hypothetical protein H6739_01285 [Alphaproteobacteria bacterium]|nr:hypothetical protein [Alphaproteobacteria bacterium]
MRAALLALSLSGCTVLDQGPDCAQVQEEAYEAWNHVFEYYERMAGLKQAEVEAAEAQLEYSTDMRERAQRARNAYRFRQQNGLQDARTGEVRKDPTIAAEQGAQARAAGARAERVADDEELDIVGVMTQVEALEQLNANATLAREIRDAAKGPPADAWAAARQGRGLTDTTLAPKAFAASERAWSTCGED